MRAMLKLSLSSSYLIKALKCMQKIKIVAETCKTTKIRGGWNQVNDKEIDLNQDHQKSD